MYDCIRKTLSKKLREFDTLCLFRDSRLSKFRQKKTEQNQNEKKEKSSAARVENIEMLRWLVFVFNDIHK